MTINDDDGDHSNDGDADDGVLFVWFLHVLVNY